MAKFCTKCGKELVDGACPSCASSEKETVSGSVDIKGSLMECVNVFKKILTKPFDAIKEFVSENKFVAGIIMVVISALSTGIYKIATLNNVYSSSKSLDSFTSSDFADILNSALSGGSVSAKPEYLKEFMTSFAMNLVLSALVIIIGYLIVSKLFKGKTSIKEMINVVAVSLTVIVMANLVNSVLVFIDGEFIANLRVYISSFATIMSTLVLYGAVKESAEIDSNKLFVSVASMSVLATIAMDLIQKVLN